MEKRENELGNDRATGTISRLSAADEQCALRELFEKIAREEGWRPGDALGRYGDRSVYFAARVGGRLAGGLQLVPGRGLDQLPHQAVWPELDAGALGNVAHVVILALDAPYRGRHGLMWPLCVAMWRFCADEGVTTLLLEATPPTLAVYRRLGFPLEIVGELREHWGEECYLCRMGVREVADALAAKAARARTYQQVLTLARLEGGLPLAPPPTA